MSDTLLLSAHARNMDDPNQAAVVRLGQVNHLQVDIANAGAPSGPTTHFPAGAMLELQFAANVGVDPAKVNVSAPNFTSSVSQGVWILTANPAAAPLKPGQLLTVDIAGFAAPSDFDFAYMLLTVAWKGLQSETGGAQSPVPFNGRAVSLEPRKALAPRSAAQPFAIAWQAPGGPMSERAAGGDIAVTAPTPPWPVDPRIAAQKASDDAEAALQAASDKVDALKAQVDQTEAAANAISQKVLQEDIAQQNHQPFDINAFKADTQLEEELGDKLGDLQGQLNAAEAQADAANQALDAALEALKTANEAPPVPPPPPPADQIINRLAFSLKNLGPPVDASSSGGTPHFLISFVTVGDEYDPWRYDALCTDEQAAAVVCNVAGDGVAGWSLEQDKGTAQWRLKLEGRFENLESVSITIDNLVSTLPAFATTMVVAYRDIPGQDDGFIPVNINKSPPWPVIGSFQAQPVSAPIQITPAPVTIYQGQSVTLSWHCWGVPETFATPVSITTFDAQGHGILWRDKLPAVGEVTYTPAQVDSQFQLDLIIPQAPASAALSITMNPVTAALSSDCTIALGGSATLTYQTTYASSAIIAPGGQRITAPDPAVSSGTFVVTPPMTTTYTLTAQGLNGPVTSSARVAIDLDYGDPVWFAAGQFVWNGNDDRLQQGWPLPSQSPDVHLQQLAVSSMDQPFVIWADTNNDTEYDDFSQGGNAPAPIVAFFNYQNLLFFVTHDPVGGAWSTSVPKQANPPDAPPSDAICQWFTNADFRGAQFRYAAAVGLLMLARDGRLFSRNREMAVTNSFEWADSGLIRDKVDAFDLDEGGQLYFVSGGALIKATINGEGAWNEQPLCLTPAISTNIAVTGAGVVYWAENQGPEGPILCRYYPQKGRQLIARLPGLAASGGICVDPKFRQPH